MNKSPFDIVDYCIKYKYIYPYNIAECLGITYKRAEIYFREYRRLNGNNHNYIESTKFFNWYFGTAES